jgi:hypothetical protein
MNVSSWITGIRVSHQLGGVDAEARMPDHLELTKNLWSGSSCKTNQPDHDSGADRVRTDDLRLARAALSQLSYSPVTLETAPCSSCCFRPERPAMVGLGRLELPTSRLSGVRSNQLSYRP